MVRQLLNVAALIAILVTTTTACAPMTETPPDMEQLIPPCATAPLGLSYKPGVAVATKCTDGVLQTLTLSVGLAPSTMYYLDYDNKITTLPALASTELTSFTSEASAIATEDKGAVIPFDEVDGGMQYRNAVAVVLNGTWSSEYPSSVDVSHVIPRFAKRARIKVVNAAPGLRLGVIDKPQLYFAEGTHEVDLDLNPPNLPVFTYNYTNVPTSMGLTLSVIAWHR